MATQTVTVSRPPADGASKTSGLPPAGGSADYSLSDEDLLGMEGASEGSAEPREGATTNAGETQDASGTDTSQQGQQGDQAASEEKQEKEEAPPPELARLFELPEVGPRLREIYERETEYRKLFPTVEDARAVSEMFPSPEAARTAAAAQGELARLDALLESPDPRAHVELIAGLKQLAPEAFRGLALTFGERLQALDPAVFEHVSGTMVAQALAAQRWPEHVALLARAAEQQDWPAVKFLAAGLAAQLEQMQRGSRAVPGAVHDTRLQSRDLPPAAANERELRQPSLLEPQSGQAALQGGAGQFLEAVNTDVEQAVRQAVDRKVEELLPDVAAGARQKVGGEIFRELDAALRKDPGLLEQVRDSVRGALRAGRGEGASGNTSPREALAQMIANRARAALPGVAKRVVADWTDTVLRTSQARRAKHSQAASRVEVGRGGTPGPVPIRPKRVDYMRMSDEDILNMD
jgi:hypothetical protein